jgi:two-component system chemotaxis sensor kinase CheA
LIDLVGELVIAHVMTKQLAEAFTPDALPKLREAVVAMERNIRELHERMMGVRMIPVGTLFQRFKRTVYDIAQSTGKQIRLETSGEETEIDKSLLELLGDSMIHLVRNAADHGIESVEERVQMGKPVEGTILLSACHRAGKMLITISDDGAGIDPARVQAKAIERGLIAPDARLTDDQIKMLIFEPGFSTRDQVSDLSGRGVGMDVVKRNVQKLSGVVMLSSEKGNGSSISIELPLTLAIMEGLLVTVDDRVLVLPLLSVVEAVCPTPNQIVRIAEQGEVLNLRQESIPILRVRRFLSSDRSAYVRKDERALEAASPSNQVVIVVEAGNKKIGLLVDGIAGQQQVVLKSLESHFHKVDGLMGVTILGDGCVAPVVDVSAISALNLFSLGHPLDHVARGSACAHPFVNRDGLHQQAAA